MKHLKITINGVFDQMNFKKYIYEETKRKKLLGWCKRIKKGFVLSIEGDEENLFELINNLLFSETSFKKIEVFKIKEIEKEGFSNFCIY